MICSRPATRSFASPSASQAPEESPADSEPSRTPYGLPFWRAYVANSLITIAWALLYRYADFVKVLGGSEYHLGWIVGIGMVGSLAMRFALGTGIDQYGPRRVWLGALAVFALTCFAHLAVTTHQGVAIYLLRIVLLSAVAGIFGSSITFISGRVSLERMAELVGMLGTSGFMGVIVGTTLGDWFCSTATVERWQVNLIFLAAGCLALAAMAFAWLATARQTTPTVRRRRPPTVSLLRRYHPGAVLMVGIVVGSSLALPTTFLRTFAQELGIARMGLFFAVYAGTAIATRVLTRRLAEQWGLRPMILVGLGVLVVAELAFLPVRWEWQFIFPAFGYGIAHAILFPTITAAGTSSFPHRYRGLGTMVILAAFDIGALVGAPAAGAIVHYSVQIGWPSYPTLFVAMAVVLLGTAALYALSPRRRPVAMRGPLPARSAAWAPHTPVGRDRQHAVAERC